MDSVFDFIGIVLGLVILARYMYTISTLIDRLDDVEIVVKGIRNRLADDEHFNSDCKTRECAICKHYRWFGEYSMHVCEKHGESNPRAVCDDYEKRGGDL